MKEEHCKGHEEDREISIADYRHEQGCDQFDDLNRDWYQLLLKKKSAGPSVSHPPKTSLQLFFLASYDLDNFIKFVQSDYFKAAYDLPDDFFREVAEDQVALMKFGFRLLRHVLFGEISIPEQKTPGKIVWKSASRSGRRSKPPNVRPMCVTGPFPHAQKSPPNGGLFCGWR